MPKRIHKKTRVFRQHMLELCETRQPLTIRQLFYAGIGIHWSKSEGTYKKLCRQATYMREDGELPWVWLVDEGRWQRKRRSFTSMEQAGRFWAKQYRVDKMARTETQVHIFTEKDSLASTLLNEIGHWDVPLWSGHGMPSVGYLHVIAENMAADGRPCRLITLLDYDPAGRRILETVKLKLRMYAPSLKLSISPMAVSAAQVKAMSLPTFEPNQKDPGYDRWIKDGMGLCAQLEAIHPNTLRSMVEAAILRHIPLWLRQEIEMEERCQRETLRQVDWSALRVS